MLPFSMMDVGVADASYEVVVGSDDESVQKFGEQRVGRVGHELHAAFTYFLCFKSTPVPPGRLPVPTKPACVRGERSGGIIREAEQLARPSLPSKTMSLS